MVRATKSNFSMCLNLPPISFFLIWKWSAFHVFNLPNYVSNPFIMQHMIKIHKLKYMNLLSIYFTTIWATCNVWKIDLKSNLNIKLIQILKPLETSTYHTFYTHVFKNINAKKFNLLIGLFFHTIRKLQSWGLLFWYTFACFTWQQKHLMSLCWNPLFWL